MSVRDDSLYERAVWQDDGLERWAVVKSRYGNGWIACASDSPLSKTSDTHAEAIAYAATQARKDPSWKR